MNLKARLNRLEQSATGPQGACPHLPPVVVTEDEDGGEVFEQRAAATDARVCWCGRERLRIRLLYTDDGRGGAAEGEEVFRLRWPEDDGRDAA